MRFKKANGFTLLELAIVLTIIGLLVGGIMGGRALIRGAEIRRVVSSSQNVIAAYQEFTTMYGDPPGDLSNATDIWGAVNASLNICVTTPSTNEATCNGDGNGFIVATPFNFGGEYFRAFQHLANAKLISGKFPGNVTTLADKTISPPTGIPTAHWFLSGSQLRTTVGDGSFFSDIDPGNFLILLGDPSTPDILTPEEAEALDRKQDDGKPGTGSVTAFKKSSDFPDCTDSDAPLTARYDVAKTNPGCALSFRASSVK